IPLSFYPSGPSSDLHSFPTRRSSDLILSDDQTLLRRRVRQMVDDYLSARGLGAPDDVRLRLTVDVLNEISGYGPLQEYLDRPDRSEEHTSELQSRENLVCRLLLEKKK